MRCTLLLIIAIVLFTGCWRFSKEGPEYVPRKVWGNKPVYSQDTMLTKPKYEAARNVVSAGKIYAYNTYLMQCETGEGIHVIDNSNPATARRIGFIQLKGASEISIRNNFLYTNSYNDLVTVDLTNITLPVEVKRQKGVFQQHGFLPEPSEKGYYECVDIYKGIVIGWKKDSITAYCYKN